MLNRTLIAAALSLAAVGAFAQSATPPQLASQGRQQVDAARDANQQKRIANGVASGQLTNRESAKLERGQTHVDRLEANAGADGHVGPREQARINRAQNRQSAKIYHQKHDAQVRG